MSSSDYSHGALTRAEILLVAGRAACDPRCVVRYLRKTVDGDDTVSITTTTIVRVERALAKCGHRALIAPDSLYAAARTIDGKTRGATK